MEVKGLLSPSFEISFLFVCVWGEGGGGELLSPSFEISVFCVCLSVCVGGLTRSIFRKVFFLLLLFCFVFHSYMEWVQLSPSFGCVWGGDGG